MTKVLNHLFLSFTIIFSTPYIFAAEPNKAEDPILDSLNYPELQVTPSASHRLLTEFKDERSNRWGVHWAIQTSALATLLTATSLAEKKDTKWSVDEAKQKKDDYDNATTLGTLVGGGWIVATILLSANYEPYKDGVVEFKKHKGEDKRARLTRERVSDSQIRAAARLGRKLRWMSVVSNFIAAGYMAVNTTDEGAAVAGLAGLLAFTPMMFPNRWEQVHEDHEYYKKKIYGPITRSKLFGTPQGLVPGLSVSFNF